MPPLGLPLGESRAPTPTAVSDALPPPPPSKPPPRAGHRVTDYGFFDAIRVLWWRLEWTKTARRRGQVLQNGIRDGRGRQESIRLARRVNL